MGHPFWTSTHTHLLPVPVTVGQPDCSRTPSPSSEQGTGPGSPRLGLGEVQKGGLRGCPGLGELGRGRLRDPLLLPLVQNSTSREGTDCRGARAARVSGIQHLPQEPRTLPAPSQLHRLAGPLDFELECGFVGGAPGAWEAGVSIAVFSS